MFHANCFACVRCGRVLAAGELYGVWSGALYCSDDYRALHQQLALSGSGSSAGSSVGLGLAGGVGSGGLSGSANGAGGAGSADGDSNNNKSGAAGAGAAAVPNGAHFVASRKPFPQLIVQCREKREAHVRIGCFRKFS